MSFCPNWSSRVDKCHVESPLPPICILFTIVQKKLEKCSDSRAWSLKRILLSLHRSLQSLNYLQWLLHHHHLLFRLVADPGNNSSLWTRYEQFYPRPEGNWVSRYARKQKNTQFWTIHVADGFFIDELKGEGEAIILPFSPLSSEIKFFHRNFSENRKIVNSLRTRISVLAYLFKVNTMKLTPYKNSGTGNNGGDENHHPNCRIEFFQFDWSSFLRLSFLIFIILPFKFSSQVMGENS